MKGPETLLEMAQRHVWEGEGRVERQAAMVTALEKRGYAEAATLGRHVLETMQVSLDMSKRHLQEIAAKAAASL